MSEDSGQQQAGQQQVGQQPAGQAMRVVRTPKYSAFIGTGVFIGVLLGIGFTIAAGDRAATYSLGSRLGYLCAIFGLLGALLGGAVAVLVERYRR